MLQATPLPLRLAPSAHWSRAASAGVVSPEAGWSQAFCKRRPPQMIRYICRSRWLQKSPERQSGFTSPDLSVNNQYQQSSLNNIPGMVRILCNKATVWT